MDLLQHLKDRHVDLQLHRPIIDETESVCTFLIWNLSGQLTGFQQYRPGAPKTCRNDPRSGRYYTYHHKNRISIWGTESLHLTPGVLFVTEGIFDAAHLTKLDVSAVAVLSNNPSGDVYNLLHSLGRRIVAVCDNDPAGRKLAKFGHHAVFTKEKDLGESTDDAVQQIINQFMI